MSLLHLVITGAGWMWERGLRRFLAGRYRVVFLAGGSCCEPATPAALADCTYGRSIHQSESTGGGHFKASFSSLRVFVGIVCRLS